MQNKRTFRMTTLEYEDDKKILKFLVLLRIKRYPVFLVLNEYGRRKT